MFVFWLRVSSFMAVRLQANGWLTRPTRPVHDPRPKERRLRPTTLFFFSKRMVPKSSQKKNVVKCSSSQSRNNWHQSQSLWYLTHAVPVTASRRTNRPENCTAAGASVQTAQETLSVFFSAKTETSESDDDTLTQLKHKKYKHALRKHIFKTTSTANKAAP